MKVAVVGLGYWGPNLVRNLQLIESCHQIVACDLDQSKVERVLELYPSVVGTTDIENVLDDAEIAAVVLSTPVPTHGKMARGVLERGKSVLVEKPLATSTAEAEGLVALASDQGLLVMAGHTFLYSAPVQCVKEMVARGEIGRPLYVQSSRVNLGIHQSEVSVLWDLAPHDLSILFDWLGEFPISVSATGRASHGYGPADVAFVNLEFPSGCVASLHLSWLAPTKLRRMTLVGSRKMIVYEDVHPDEPVKLYDKGVNLPAPDDYGSYRLTYRTGDIISPRVDVREPLREELRDFLGRVGRGETPDEREEAAVRVVSVIEAAEKSLLARGAPVSP